MSGNSTATYHSVYMVSLSLSPIRWYRPPLHAPPPSPSLDLGSCLRQTRFHLAKHGPQPTPYIGWGVGGGTPHHTGGGGVDPTPQGQVGEGRINITISGWGGGGGEPAWIIYGRMQYLHTHTHRIDAAAAAQHADARLEWRSHASRPDDLQPTSSVCGEFGGHAPTR